MEIDDKIYKKVKKLYLYVNEKRVSMEISIDKINKKSKSKFYAMGAEVLQARLVVHFQ